jgi:pimeloyl-ACP methyl ester carboxylesterase
LHISHFVANGAVQTAYWAVGDEQSNAPLVLVHGFTGSKLDFQDQLAWFGQTRPVLAYDQRGHGETSNARPYDFYTLVNDFFGFLDALEVDNAHVLGHSMGGMVVMRAALAKPERFRSMILMDTSAGPLELFPAELRSRLNEIVVEHGCAALVDGMHGKPQTAPVRRAIDFLGEHEHWRRIRVKLEQMDPAAFQDLGELLADHPSVLSSLGKLTTPTTIIVGAEDEPFIEPSRDLADALPNARLATIRDAGHSPQYENAAIWREALDSHLANTDANR